MSLRCDDTSFIYTPPLLPQPLFDLATLALIQRGLPSSVCLNSLYLFLFFFSRPRREMKGTSWKAGKLASK